ncbi:MAG: NPCBM/NEW2 domain-containing protein, partial [Opitutales bacterium]|nr:NPCBM/NEW2 domain-containing protein [Opitutales bacterium]
MISQTFAFLGYHKLSLVAYTFAGFVLFNFAWSQSTNLALEGTASQISTWGGADASRAIDDNTNGDYYAGSICHTTRIQNAWWDLDLGGIKSIDHIVLWNRTDAFSWRLYKFHILVSDEPFPSEDLNTCLSDQDVFSIYEDQSVDVSQFSINRTGRFVRIQGTTYEWFHVAEVQVFGSDVASGGLQISISSIGLLGAVFLFVLFSRFARFRGYLGLCVLGIGLIHFVSNETFASISTQDLIFHFDAEGEHPYQDKIQGIDPNNYGGVRTISRSHERVYLTDLEAYASECASGGLNKVDSTIIKDVEFDTGLNCHATTGGYLSFAAYDLTGSLYSKLIANVGFVNPCSASSASFRFLADGSNIFTTPVLYENSRPYPIDLNISGANDLRLEIGSETNNADCDRTVWAEAYLVPQGADLSTASFYDGQSFLDYGYESSYNIGNYSNELTLSVWFKNNFLSSNGGTYTLICRNRDVGGRRGYLLSIYSDHIVFRVGYAHDSANEWQIPCDFDTGWHHLVVKLDNGWVKYYLDGKKLDEESDFTGKNLNSANAPLRLGAYGTSSNPKDRFEGYIDDVRIYSRAVSEAEIASLFLENADLVAHDAPFQTSFSAEDGYVVGPLNHTWRKEKGEAFIVAEGLGNQALSVGGSEKSTTAIALTAKSQSAFLIKYKVKLEALTTLPEAKEATISGTTAKVCFLKNDINSGEVYVWADKYGLGENWYSTGKKYYISAENVSSDWIEIESWVSTTDSKWNLIIDDHLVAANQSYSPSLSYIELEINASGGRKVYLDDLSTELTSSYFSDSDADGLFDGWETFYANDLTTLNPAEDSDQDGLTNQDEFFMGLDPVRIDTDGDGLEDGFEITEGLNPATPQDVQKVVYIGSGAYGYETGFEVSDGMEEGILNGQEGWFSDSSVMVDGIVAANSTNTSQVVHLQAPGTQGEGSEAYTYISAPNLQEVWISFDAVLPFGSLVAPETEGKSAIFQPDHNGLLHVYHAGEWQAGSITLNAGSWSHISICINYLSKRWDLYVDGELAASWIEFADSNVDSLSKISFLKFYEDASQASWIDNFEISNTRPISINFDSDNDGLNNDKERALGTQITSSDTDGDGSSDGWEYLHGLDPLVIEDFSSLLEGYLQQPKSKLFDLGPTVFYDRNAPAGFIATFDFPDGVEI